MIKNRFESLIIRGMPSKYIKYKKSNCNHLTNEKKIKLYEYYVCDNCNCEIKIKSKWGKSEGGVILLPRLLTHKTQIYIAVCNKCLNEVLREFEGAEEK